VLVLAQEEARLLGHSFLGTEHLLLGLIHEGDGLAAKALEELGISLEAVRSAVEEHISPSGSAPTGSPPFTPRAKRVLELSLREALALGHNHIGTEHILLGLVREGEGVAAQVLVGLGADLPRVRQQVISMLTGYQSEGAPAPEVVAELRKRRRGASNPVPVGKEWFAQVVRAGRRPEDYAEAYAELAELAVGFDLGQMPADEITCASIETSDGPGLIVSVLHRIEDEPPG
jgi:ATP-dependent Clp protease ATP-binding subunit ClpC